MNITGKGCIYVNASKPSVSVDLSKGFDQTLYFANASPLMLFYGSQASTNIPIIRGLSSSAPTVVNVGPITDDSALSSTDVEYDSTGGILNITNTAGTYLLDIGTGYDASLMFMAFCTSSDFGARVCVYLNSAPTQALPSSCEVAVAPHQDRDAICPPAPPPLPPATTLIAPYDSSNVTRVIEYYTTVDSGSLPITTKTTTYGIPSFTEPMDYNTTMTNSDVLIVEDVIYGATTGTISGMPELTTLSFIDTTTKTYTYTLTHSSTFTIPPPYTTTFTSDNMTVSGVVSYYSTDSDSQPATGTTTLIDTVTSYVTVTMTEYEGGTIDLTSYHYTTGTWESTVTFSSDVETYVIRMSSTSLLSPQPTSQG